jgi:hypothetical protein
MLSHVPFTPPFVTAPEHDLHSPVQAVLQQ